MDRPQWYSDMQSAVGSLFDEYVRQAEVETQAQAGLLEDEADEIEADVNDYSSFGKRRAIILRPFIEQLVLKHRQQWEQDNRSKRTGNLRKSAREPRICLEENQLTVNDWVVLEHLAKLLGFYEDAVKTLEGDGQQRKRKGGWVGSYGNVWEVIQGFEFLLEVLEDYKQLASEIPDAEHFRINVNLGWEKLNKYYSRLDETPIYYTALALHPAFRWGYFENEWKDNTEWVMKAKQMVREVWESDYRHLQVRIVSARGRFSDTVW
ncbi:hypothetical protein FOFC_13940 [Fusarium oxysporum]|nr:hypothetical protein FOFC_13940 [Fusarium oxysporum]